MAEQEFAQPDLKLGIYRHYKGNNYEVIGLACHSESLNWMVLYKPLYPHHGMPDIWIRPYEMFIETITFNSMRVPRFTYVHELDKQ